MRQKTQTDRARPTLCHAAVERPGGGSGASGVHAKGGATTERETGRLAPRSSAHNFSGRGGSKDVGAAFEAHALVFLQRQRLRLVARNVVCRGGEIDLVMRERDGALVFVEVRARAQRHYGGAAASIGWQKRQRLVRAARHYLATRVSVVPACRFDVVAFEAGRLVWLRDAFRADEV
jgi:putative endonuclease